MDVIGDGRAVGLGWKSLVSMGVSGGMVPCPTALVVLLTAIAFHKTLFGLLLVASFSAGLSAVLVLIGVMVVLVGDRFVSRAGSRLVSMLPLGSVFIIIALGIIIAWRGFGAVGG